MDVDGNENRPDSSVFLKLSTMKRKRPLSSTHFRMARTSYKPIISFSACNGVLLVGRRNGVLSDYQDSVVVVDM